MRNSQLLREIEEVEVLELLLAYHGERQTSHMFTRHMHVSLSELKNRLKHIHVDQDEIVKASRFLSNDLSEIASLLHTCLDKNYSRIEKWNRSGRIGKLDISYIFPSPIGECIAMNTNWKHTFKESELVIVLGESNLSGRIFQILTAYPEATPEEVDLIYDAIDEWFLTK